MKYFKKLIGERIYLSPQNNEEIENNKETTSVNLNTNDGEILVKVIGTEGVVLQYSFDNYEFISYDNTAIVDSGHYVFQAILDGIVLDSVEFDVSNMMVGD